MIVMHKPQTVSLMSKANGALYAPGHIGRALL